MRYFFHLLVVVKICTPPFAYGELPPTSRNNPNLEVGMDVDVVDTNDSTNQPMGSAPFEDRREATWLANLSNENPIIRKNAVFYLGEMRSQKSVDALLALLLKEDESLAIKIQVLRAIRRIGEWRILDQLKAQYQAMNLGHRLQKHYLITIGLLEKIRDKESKKQFFPPSNTPDY